MISLYVSFEVTKVDEILRKYVEKVREYREYRRRILGGRSSWKKKNI